MIDQQLADLRAKAQAATPGPWVHHRQMYGVGRLCQDGSSIYVGSGENIQTASFIAAANPATVLAMIDEIERLRERNEKLERVREAAQGVLTSAWTGDPIPRLRAALAAAKEQTDG